MNILLSPRGGRDDGGQGTPKPCPVAASTREALAKGDEERHDRRRGRSFPVRGPGGDANVQSGLIGAVNGFEAVSLGRVCAFDYYQNFEAGC